MNLNTLMGILLARKWAIIASCALALLAAAILILLTPKSYTASIDLLVDSRGLDPISGQSQPARMTGAYLATQSDIIRSRNVAGKVIDQLALGSSPAMIKAAKLTGEPERDQRRMLSFLAKGLIVVPKRDSSVLSIAFKAQDPQLAAQIADAYAEAYMYTNLELRIEPAKQTTQWYNQQLTGMRQELIEKQEIVQRGHQARHAEPARRVVAAPRRDIRIRRCLHLQRTKPLPCDALLECLHAVTLLRH